MTPYPATDCNCLRAPVGELLRSAQSTFRILRDKNNIYHISLEVACYTAIDNWNEVVVFRTHKPAWMKLEGVEEQRNLSRVFLVLACSLGLRPRECFSLKENVLV